MAGPLSGARSKQAQLDVKNSRFGGRRDRVSPRRVRPPLIFGRMTGYPSIIR